MQSYGKYKWRCLMAKKKKCGGYCTECKLFDKENQFPGLRRIS
jgi:L-lysine 2,3-aminomutase